MVTPLLRERVREALKNAEDNGFEMRKMSVADIAVDLQRCDADLEDETLNDLIIEVQAWLAEVEHG